jgi:hypothetical protein
LCHEPNGPEPPDPPVRPRLPTGIRGGIFHGMHEGITRIKESGGIPNRVRSGARVRRGQWAWIPAIHRTQIGRLGWLACVGVCVVAVALVLAPSPLLGQQTASSPSTSSPTSGTVRGSVLDPSTGRGVPAALVEFLDEGGEVRTRDTTREDGSFVLQRVPRGEFRLRVSRLGFATTLSEPRRIESGETLLLTVWARPDAIPLAPLEVEARGITSSPVLASFYSRARTAAAGAFITRDEIERLRPTRVSDLLAILPGAVLEPRSSPLTSPGILLSENPSGIGGRPCPVSVFLDGRPVPRNLSFPDHPPQAVLLDHLIRPDEVEGIEFYGSIDLVPPAFRALDTRCGVMAIWRRDGR